MSKSQKTLIEFYQRISDTNQGVHNRNTTLGQIQPVTIAEMTSKPPVDALSPLRNKKSLKKMLTPRIERTGAAPGSRVRSGGGKGSKRSPGDGSVKSRVSQMSTISKNNKSMDKPVWMPSTRAQ